MPEVADSDGSTILYAALSNPSSRDGSTLRDVDVACFRVLERRGILVAKRVEHETCSSPLLLLLLHLHLLFLFLSSHMASECCLVVSTQLVRWCMLPVTVLAEEENVVGRAANSAVGVA